MVRSETTLEQVDARTVLRFVRRGRRRPPIVRAHPIRYSYVDPLLGPHTSCGSTGEDPFPVGNPLLHVSEVPAQPLKSSNLGLATHTVHEYHSAPTYFISLTSNRAKWVLVR